IGLGTGLCRLIYLACDTEARPGDVVTASEQSSLPTKGVLIGEIIRILKDKDSLYASAVVRPSSNLFKIEEVLCVE
ncbi:MAG: rod shape-determining protein MreC, partial [Candidatus Omnitrophica bacterium]|nr:rod shape-determining protein MreC [Candidatus Omnitrophota bacterium]